MIYKSILGAIGNTPIVYLEKYSSKFDVNVYAKMESLNPGGSHKVRIALNMIADAQKRGILVPHTGQTIIEPSGGNTGMGLAIVSNLLGYNLILVIPDNYSLEKQKLLRLFGAEVVLSNSLQGNNSHGELAMKITLNNPDYVLLNQQRNPANPDAHRRSTAIEIVRDFSGKAIDFLVAGIGTGGHITGLTETLKMHWPKLSVFGVEPDNCDLLSNKHGRHDIQGLSIGVIPDTLDVEVLSGMVKVTTEECLSMVREIILTESISLGISSAANLVAISKLSKNTIPSGSNVLTMIYDGVDSYLDYFN